MARLRMMRNGRIRSITPRRKGTARRRKGYWPIIPILCAPALIQVSTLVRTRRLEVGRNIERTIETFLGGTSPAVANERAAIVTLVTGQEKDVDNLCNGLKHLSNLPDARRDDLTMADVLVFHEVKDMQSESMGRLQKCTNRTVTFAEVDFEQYPAGFDAEREESRWQKRSKWGYNQMIRFFITGLWSHPAIVGEYDLIMRLDADSCWREMPPGVSYPYLPRNYVYERFENGSDGKDVCEGLYNFTAKYIEKEQLQVADPHRWNDFEREWKEHERCLGYFNNFEITRVDFMNQPKVRQWHESVTEMEPFGVYRFRWGDALIRYLTLTLFADPDMLSYHNNTEYYEHPCRTGVSRILVDVAAGSKVLHLPKKLPDTITFDQAKSLLGFKIVRRG